MKQSHSIHPAMLKMCAAISLVFVAASAGAAEQKFVMETDRIIVKYKDAVPDSKGAAKAAKAALKADRKAKLDRAGQEFGMTVAESHAISTGARVFKLNGRKHLQEVEKLAAEMMARDPEIEYAEPDRIMTHMATANDPYYAQQWHYTDATGGLRLPTAWDKSTGLGVVVAVIDTGYRPHADLSGQFLAGYDFISTAAIGNDGNGRDSDASDPGDWVAAGECGAGSPASGSSWHGTHVAGTVAAKTNNSLGVAGVAYNAKIVPVRVLGKCGGYTSDIADAITWSSGGTVSGVPANANKAKVLNMSLGGTGACDATTQNAINGARSRGSVVVVAAGNDNMNVSNASPANCSGVIAVAATGKTGG
ncbi:MAG: peptidase S8, partial [Massilia sp.]